MREDIFDGSYSGLTVQVRRCRVGLHGVVCAGPQPTIMSTSRLSILDSFSRSEIDIHVASLCELHSFKPAGLIGVTRRRMKPDLSTEKNKGFKATSTDPQYTINAARTQSAKRHSDVQLVKSQTPIKEDTIAAQDRLLQRMRVSLSRK